MLSSDLLSCFRAQVTYWCVSIQKERGSTSSTDNTTILKPPFRLITHGHELTPDFDMKTLAELGMRDQQVSFLSVFNILNAIFLASTHRFSKTFYIWFNYCTFICILTCILNIYDFSLSIYLSPMYAKTE